MNKLTRRVLIEKIYNVIYEKVITLKDKTFFLETGEVNLEKKAIENAILDLTYKLIEKNYTSKQEFDFIIKTRAELTKQYYEFN